MSWFPHQKYIKTVICPVYRENIINITNHCIFNIHIQPTLWPLLSVSLTAFPMAHLSSFVIWVFLLLLPLVVVFVGEGGGAKLDTFSINSLVFQPAGRQNVGKCLLANTNYKGKMVINWASPFLYSSLSVLNYLTAKANIWIEFLSTESDLIHLNGHVHLLNIRLFWICMDKIK